MVMYVAYVFVTVGERKTHKEWRKLENVMVGPFAVLGVEEEIRCWQGLNPATCSSPC